MYRETCRVTPHQTSTPKTKPKLQPRIAMLYVFEDNEAMIKMIIKGRSPTMRHVSRTHRVSLDWLFDRIILDPGMKIRYIDTKHKIADVLTKGHFTRDEWNHLLCLFNISHFSSLCCAKNFNLISCTERMAKRMQEQSEENRIVAESRPTAMNLTSSVTTTSSSVNSPIAPRSPGKVKASSRQVGLSGRLDASTYQNSNTDATSSSQGWRRDAQLFTSTGKLVATDKDRKSLNRQEKPVISTGELVATEYQGCSGNPEVPLDCVLFMSVTLQAAVHLGRDYSLNLPSVQNSFFEVCGANISDN